MIQLKYVLRAMFFTLLILGGSTVFAQDWPSKPVRIIFPYAPGGSGDAVARNLAKRIEIATKQTVTVENITGGGTVVAAQSVINSAPDGIKLFFTGTETMTVMKHTNSRLPIDPDKELTPITFVNTLPHWLVVRADRAEKTLLEFIELIRKNPGTVNISVNSIGGAAHLSLANWAKKNNLDFTIVPYRGSAPAMIDLIGGVTTAHVDVVGSSLPFVKDRKVKALSMLQQNPLADFPDVPASPAENKGGLLINIQHLLAVKSGTPSSTVNRIYDVVKQVTAEPEFIEFLRNYGYERSIPTPAKTKELLESESKKFGDIERLMNIKFN